MSKPLINGAVTDVSDPSNHTQAPTITSSDTLEQSLREWLHCVFPDQDFSLTSLAGDASSRRYHRLYLKDTSDNYMVMDSSSESDAMRQFINVATLMSPAINVPTLIAQDTEKGFLVLQDFGSTEFAHLLGEATPKQVDALYQQAMQTLIDLQRIPVDTARIGHQLPDYDNELLDREMDLFSDWFVPFIGVTLDKEVWQNLKKVLIAQVLAQPQVIVHRDYHSRNLMQDEANTGSDAAQLGVIDFQDAVIGAYSYDLISLVRDAYVDWTDDQVSGWIADFWHMQRKAGLSTADSVQAFEADVAIMGIQRHLKVLGIFIRLSQRDGKDRYLADIPKVMRDLLFELEWLSKHGNDAIREAVQPFYQWLKSAAMPAYERKFTQS